MARYWDSLCGFIQSARMSKCILCDIFVVLLLDFNPLSLYSTMSNFASHWSFESIKNWQFIKYCRLMRILCGVYFWVMCTLFQSDKIDSFWLLNQLDFGSTGEINCIFGLAQIKRSIRRSARHSLRMKMFAQFGFVYFGFKSKKCCWNRMVAFQHDRLRRQTQ